MDSPLYNDHYSSLIILDNEFPVENFRVLSKLVWSKIDRVIASFYVKNYPIFLLEQPIVKRILHSVV